MVWLIIDTFWGKHKEDIPDDDSAGKSDPDSMDK